MRDLKLTQSYAIIALNAQDSKYMTVSKIVSLHCVAASALLELYLDGYFTEVEDKLTLEKSVLKDSKITLYQGAVLKPLFARKDMISENLIWWLKKATNLSRRHLKEVEVAVVDSLKGVDLIEEIPNLLGCDLYYKSSGLSLKEYRSNSEEYLKVMENIKAQVLEEGALDDEIIYMLWLLRESTCLQEVFSKSELETVNKKMNELSLINNTVKALYSINIYHGIEISIKGFLNMKKNAIKTPTGTGINFVFPIIERSQSIFIDTEEWFPNAKQRFEEVKKRLEENSHNYTVIREGKVSLIKIDNIIYEAIPEAITGRIAIHGVRLRRYPI